MTNDTKLEQYQDIIDKLHSGIELNVQEKSIVETDTDFQEYQKELGLIEKAISHSVLEEKLSVMNKLEEKYSDEQPKKKTLGRRSYLLLAAAFILLLLAFFLFNQGDDSYDGDLLAEDFVMDFPDPDNTRSGGNGSDIKTTDDPYKLYQAENSSLDSRSYYKPTKAFQELIKTDDNPKHKFYLGICYLRDSKWKEAEAIFENEQLKELKNYPINYFLAVSKVGLEKTDEAIELFDSPISSYAVFNAEGQKNIEKLNRMRNR